MGEMKNLQLVKRVFFCLTGYKKRLAVVVFLSFISAIFISFMPYLSRPLLDKGYGNRDIKTVLIVAVIGFAIFSFNAITKTIFQLTSQRLKKDFLLETNRKYLQKMYALPISFLNLMPAGEQIYRISRDLQGVVEFAVARIPLILTLILKIAIYTSLVFWLNFRLSFVVFLFVPLLVWHASYFRKRYIARYENKIQVAQQVGKEIHDVFSKSYLIKALGSEKYEQNRVLALFKNREYLNLEILRLNVLHRLSSSALNKMAVSFVGLFGMILTIKGGMSLGSLAAFTVYFSLLLGTVSSTVQTAQKVSTDFIHIRRFFEVLDLDVGLKDGEGAEVTALEGEVEFKNISFGYDKAKGVIENFNFKIPANRWTAITGPSGCGKTTLLRLILRLYESDKGIVLIDGKDVKDIKITSLRKNIAVATQRAMILNRSIKDNIAHGLDKTLDEINKAAKIACIDSFIQSLSGKYDTIVGENGYRLSKGQMQRICLARAIIRNPKVLILDEALSSVDMPTEKKIYENLKEKRQDLTTIIVTQNPETAKAADLIFQMEFGGKIAGPFE